MVSNGTFRVRMGICRESPWHPFLWMCVLALMSLVLGCGYPDKYPSHLQKIDDRANAFRMVVLEPFGLFAPKERVRLIRVFEFGAGTRVGRLCWEVVAETPVPAQGFEVVAGQVPKGFMQIFPPAGESFTPTPGRSYDIFVVMAHPLASPRGAPTRWIAE
jgi:hypothetical protein